MTALMLAASLNNQVIVKLLLDRGANIESHAIDRVCQNNFF